MGDPERAGETTQGDRIRPFALENLPGFLEQSPTQIPVVVSTLILHLDSDKTGRLL
jgi:hypothetical protein